MFIAVFCGDGIVMAHLLEMFTIAWRTGIGYKYSIEWQVLQRRKRCGTVVVSKLVQLQKQR
jgi:hypothetical protein